MLQTLLQTGGQFEFIKFIFVLVSCSFPANFFLAWDLNIHSHIVLCGRKGHVASIDMYSKNLRTELELRERCRDAVFTHNHTMFAVAQSKTVYMYDGITGAEVHCLRNHFEPTRLAFLKYHWLLVSIVSFSRPAP